MRSRGRAFTFSGHVGLEFLVGLALGVAPFVLDFDSGATVVSIGLGVATVTIALSTSVAGHAIPAHHAWDRGLFVLLLLAAVTSAIAEIGSDTAVFAGAAVIEGVLLVNTRYTAERI